VTIPQKAASEAGLKISDRLRVSAQGYGRLVIERIELPSPTQPTLNAPVATGLRSAAPDTSSG